MKVNPDYKRPPRWEVTLYVLVGILSISTICYHVFVASDKLYKSGRLNSSDFVSGWTILPNDKDISNFEWGFWYQYFWNVLPWYCGNTLLGMVLTLFNLKTHQKSILLVFSMTCLVSLLGVYIMCFYVLYSIVVFVASRFKSKLLVWITSLSLLTTLNLEYLNEHFLVHVYGGHDDYEGHKYYIFTFCLAFALLRNISFGLEKCTSPDGLGYSLLDFLHYVYYLPLFFTGPILTFDLFSQQWNQDGHIIWTIARLKVTIWNFGRVIFWGVFNEFIIHFFYFDALHRQPKILNALSLWTLVGIAFCKGQFFMTNYVVMYELPGEIAKLEGLDPPRGPKCISYIYRYSHMWKCFDCGFYNFTKRYIYIPIGGSRHGVLRQLTGSLLCFLFIFVWHGAELYILFWCLLNYIGCTVEGFGGWFANTDIVVKYLDKIGTDNNRRLNGIVSVPLYLLSTMGIFMFFGGNDVGKIFIYRMIINISWPAFSFLVFLLYCNIQNAIFIQDWQNRQKLKQL